MIKHTWVWNLAMCSSHFSICLWLFLVHISVLCRVFFIVIYSKMFSTSTQLNFWTFTGTSELNRLRGEANQKYVTEFAAKQNMDVCTLIPFLHCIKFHVNTSNVSLGKVICSIGWNHFFSLCMSVSLLNRDFKLY